VYKNKINREIEYRVFNELQRDEFEGMIIGVDSRDLNEFKDLNREVMNLNAPFNNGITIGTKLK